MTSVPIYPMFAANAIVSDSATDFLLAGSSLTVRVPGNLLKQLLLLCNGRNRVEEILEKVKKQWDIETVSRFMGELAFRSVLVEANTFLQSQWHYMENLPIVGSGVSDERVGELEKEAMAAQTAISGGSCYPVTASALTELLGRRTSTRSFNGRPVPMQAIAEMLWSAYGWTNEGLKTVPSGGALYPLCLHVALFQGAGDLDPGIYRCVLAQPMELKFVRIAKDFRSFQHSFMNPRMLEDAHGALVLGADLSRQSEKYGNRSLLYAALEAGHAAQNVHLAAASNAVGSVEIGGFVDAALTKVLDLAQDIHPITSVVFGDIGSNQAQSLPRHEWVVPYAAGYQAPFAIAQARVSPEINDDWSYGRDAIPSIALAKAISEAREWAACGCVSDQMVFGQYKSLPTAIDPRTVIAYTDRQYTRSGFPFSRFQENIEYAWVPGVIEQSGEEALVLADLVYFPYYPEHPLYTYANSSGVAAHPDRNQALRTAVLELIERDAFLNAFCTRLPTPKISEATLPDYLRQRIEQIRLQGLEVVLKDISLEYGPVVLVYAWSEQLHYMTCSACSSFDIEHAISHALMETEASIVARLQNGPSAYKSPRQVEMPADHGSLYEQNQYYQHANFLAVPEREIRFDEIGCDSAMSWDALCQILNSRNTPIVSIPLEVSPEYGGNGGLHIVRAIIPGMVPMTFGYGLMPLGVQRIYDIAKARTGRTLKEERIPLFPHPFA